MKFSVRYSLGFYNGNNDYYCDNDSIDDYGDNGNIDDKNDSNNDTFRRYERISIKHLSEN